MPGRKRMREAWQRASLRGGIRSAAHRSSRRSPTTQGDDPSGRTTIQNNTSDYVMEGLMRSLVHASRIVMQDPTNYEARSNVSWVTTWALNTFVGCGKGGGDWEIHMIGQAMGAVTDATHGMTLSAVTLPYYRMVMPYGTAKFARFATAVWDVPAEGKTELELAEASLQALSDWMDEIKVVRHASELGLTEEMFDDVVAGTFLLTGGYKTLTADDVRQILTQSM